jgi:ABC-type uncharacterized transport system substrate-binding protein
MAAVFLGFVGGAGRAEAHPHVWVTVETEVLHDAQKNITGFRHHWTFDEFYSKFAIEGLDKNNDGILDRNELKELADVNVQSLREYGFFTFPKIGKKDVEGLQPVDYFIEYNKENGMLTLHFTLPLKEPVPRAKLKDFNFAVYDPTFYVAFAFADKDPIRMAEGMTDCHPEISKPEPQMPAKSLGESIFSKNEAMMGFGQQFAETVKLKCGAGS